MAAAVDLQFGSLQWPLTLRMGKDCGPSQTLCPLPRCMAMVIMTLIKQYVLVYQISVLDS